MSFGERVRGSPPQTLVFHRAHFGNHVTSFLPGSSSSWFSGRQTMGCKGGGDVAWVCPPCSKGPPPPPSQPVPLTAPSPRPCSSGKGQSRLVESGTGAVKLASVALDTCPTAVTLLAWERRAARLCRAGHCGPIVPPHLAVLPTLAWPPWLPRHRACGLCPCIRDRKGSPCVLGMAAGLQQDCGPVC